VAGPDVKVDDLTAGVIRTVFDVNVLGLAGVTHVFLPLLHRSQTAVIVTSAAGSVRSGHDRPGQLPVPVLRPA
jgi:NADP-dependent 3-hydroxy acid dehydrogenase YdfG